MTGFVALRCYKCSMMQVKQARKPGSKWTCAICNEKQSEVKVYASSITARELRTFVQDFNLSAGSAAHSAIMELAEQPEGVVQERTDQPAVEANQLPSKWTDYLSDQDCDDLDDPNDAREDRRYVTSFPDPRCAKRKAAITYDSTAAKPKQKRRDDCARREPGAQLITGPQNDIPTSKQGKRTKAWPDRVPATVEPIRKPVVSRWSSFLQEEEE